MRRSTSVATVGVLAAGLILTAGYMNARRLEEKQFRARLDCERGQSLEPHASSSTPQQERMDVRLPDGTILSDVPKGTTRAEVTKRLHGAHGTWQSCVADKPDVPTEAEIHNSMSWFGMAATTVAILSALPWAWYFLLRRIAELRAAIGGNPPIER